MKRVLLMINEYPPLGGGSGNAAMSLVNQLQNDPEIMIDVITASTDKQKTEKQGNSHLYFLDIGKQGKNFHFQSIKDLLLFSYKSLFLALKLTKKTHYHVMVCYGGIPTGYLGFLIHLIRNIPYVIRLQGSDVPTYEKRWKWVDTFIFSWLSPFIWKKAKNIHANSKGLKELASHFFPEEKIGIIENGVDTDFYSPEIKNKPQQKLILLGVGRLIPRKNFSLILEAVGHMDQSQKQDIEIWLAGDGSQKSILEDMGKKYEISVKLLGVQEKSALREIYKKADVFILPSENEGMSNALLEAMSSGLPCLVSNTGGTQENIENHINGFILEDLSWKCLKEKIEYMIQYPQERKKMGKMARKKAESKNWQQVAIQYKTLLSQI